MIERVDHWERLRADWKAGSMERNLADNSAEQWVKRKVEQKVGLWAHC